MSLVSVSITPPLLSSKRQATDILSSLIIFFHSFPFLSFMITIYHTFMKYLPWSKKEEFIQRYNNTPETTNTIMGKTSFKRHTTNSKG